MSQPMAQGLAMKTRNPFAVCRELSFRLPCDFGRSRFGRLPIVVPGNADMHLDAITEGSNHADAEQFIWFR